jgi:hypothetical protein
VGFTDATEDAQCCGQDLFAYDRLMLIVGIADSAVRADLNKHSWPSAGAGGASGVGSSARVCAANLAARRTAASRDRVEPPARRRLIMLLKNS